MQNIETPAILLNLDVMENNMKNFQQMANASGKALWPMVKTHKSTEIARMQMSYGAAGYLCGTLDECEALVSAGHTNIMYAYPVANEPNISRVVQLSKDCNFYIRIDHHMQAEILNKAAKSAGVCVNYVVIIDSGLKRFGISPLDIADFVKVMGHYENLIFKGVSTHPGHVYDFENDVSRVALAEINAMETACKVLDRIGIRPELVTSGSTPTFAHVVNADAINVLHPGNYVFMDNIQVALGCTDERSIALTVLATILSVRKDENGCDVFIIDAGSKCFGDQGVHGSVGLKEKYGQIKNYPGLELYSLSEEVGKIRGANGTGLTIGDKIELIPNHSCSVANMTGWYVCMRGGSVVGQIAVDIRGNSNGKLYLV